MFQENISDLVTSAKVNTTTCPRDTLFQVRWWNSAVLLQKLKRKSCSNWLLEKDNYGRSCVWTEKGVSYHLHIVSHALQGSHSLPAPLWSCHLPSGCTWRNFGDGMLGCKKNLFPPFLQSTVGKMIMFSVFPSLLRKKKGRKKSIPCFLTLLAMQNNAPGWSWHSGGFFKEDKSQIFILCFQFLKKNNYLLIRFFCPCYAVRGQRYSHLQECFLGFLGVFLHGHKLIIIIDYILLWVFFPLKSLLDNMLFTGFLKVSQLLRSVIKNQGSAADLLFLWSLMLYLCEKDMQKIEESYTKHSRTTDSIIWWNAGSLDNVLHFWCNYNPELQQMNNFLFKTKHWSKQFQIHLCNPSAFSGTFKVFIEVTLGWRW